MNVRRFEQVLQDDRRDVRMELDAMRRYLTALGFIERTKGSHHVFGLPGIARPITLQRDGRRCKVYQVRQVRKLLLENGLRL